MTKTGAVEEWGAREGPGTTATQLDWTKAYERMGHMTLWEDATASQTHLVLMYACFSTYRGKDISGQREGYPSAAEERNEICVCLNTQKIPRKSLVTR